MSEAEWGRALSEKYLSLVLPRRWRHVQSVAVHARAIGLEVGVDGDALVAAAWLHDIGYASSLVDSDFHPLDGARFLRRIGADDRGVCLVAHHTGAMREAALRGLDSALARIFHQEVGYRWAGWVPPFEGRFWAVGVTVRPLSPRVGAGFHGSGG